MTDYRACNLFVTHNCYILQFVVLDCSACLWSCDGIWHQWHSVLRSRPQAAVCSLQQCSGGRLLARAYSEETQWLQTGREPQMYQRILLQWWVVRAGGIIITVTLQLLLFHFDDSRHYSYLKHLFLCSVTHMENILFKFLSFRWPTWFAHSPDFRVQCIWCVSTIQYVADINLMLIPSSSLVI